MTNQQEQRYYLSIIIPVQNEEGNIETLVDEVRTVAKELRENIEIIVIEDHSTDGSFAILEQMKLSLENAYTIKKSSFMINLSVLKLVEQTGKQEALRLGLSYAHADIIVTMDGDLQNDPKDIPRLLAEMHNCDMVCGVRLHRKDFISKRVTSMIANTVRNILTGDTIRDSGCALRIMNRRCLEDLLNFKYSLFGRAFIFYPTIARNHGLIVREATVSHRTRNWGKSKYGHFRGRFAAGVKACLLLRSLLIHSSR